MQILDGLTVGQLTPAVLLGITVLMLLKGWLVPRATLQDKIKEADQWREAYEAERSARTTSDAQTRELFEVAKASAGFLKAVSDRAQVGSGDV